MTEKEIFNIFNDALNGKITPNAVHEIFDGIITPDASHRVFGGKALYYSNKVEVTIYPKTIINMLNAYLQGEKAEEDLYEWAAFIMGMACFFQPNIAYCRDNPDDYAAADKYEDMWLVIQQTSCPAIDRPITPERARQYIKELSSKYDD